MSEKGKILRDDNEVANELHSYFNCIVSSLGITENKYIIDKFFFFFKPIDKAIIKFQFHPSILLIIRKINKINSFSFKESKLMMLIKKYVP